MEEAIINRYEVLMIGGSAGSLEVLLQVLPQLKEDLSLAVIIILHRKNAESQLAELLGDISPWSVKEAEEKEKILPGTVYIAPADYHLLIEKDKTFSLDYSEKINYSRPSIDASFETAAEAYGKAVIAILLSGANADGSAGLEKIKQAGGVTIAQNPEEASVSYMPQQAIDNLAVDYIAGTQQMIEIIHQFSAGKS